MNQDQFDNNIRKALENRRLNPGDKTWESLDAKLDAGEGKKKPKRRFLPYTAIAVILIIGLIIGFYPRERAPVPVVVIELNPEFQKKPPPSIEKAPLLQKPIETNKNLVPLETDQELNIAKSKSENTVSEEKTPSPSPEKNTFEKEAFRVAQNIAEKAKKGKVTDKEIDRLIRNALVKIRAEKQLEPKNNVNAQALLREVEAELDKSFRERVFYVLNKSVETVKNAFANANH